MAPQVVCVGNFSIDDVEFADGRRAPGSLGGGAAYSALGARLWGVEVGCVGSCGDDFGPQRQALERAGLDMRGVRTLPGPTLHYRLVYAADGTRVFHHVSPPERYEELGPVPQSAPADYWQARVWHLAAMARSTEGSVVAELRRRGLAYVLDVNEHVGELDRATLEGWIAGARLFAPSREEAATLVGFDDPERAVELLRAPGAGVIVKLGAAGALVAEAAELGGGGGRVLALPVEAVDTTGAGDAFCGGCAAALARGRGLVEAARWGTVSASFAVASHGMQALLAASGADAERRLEEVVVRPS